jgi:hypothetical protein
VLLPLLLQQQAKPPPAAVTVYNICDSASASSRTCFQLHSAAACLQLLGVLLLLLPKYTCETLNCVLLTAHASNAAAVRDCCSPSHKLLRAAFTCNQQQQQQQQQERQATVNQCSSA